MHNLLTIQGGGVATREPSHQSDDRNAQLLIGTIIGTPIYRPNSTFSNAIAEAYIDDAASLGMWFVIAPDGDVWRSVPVNDGPERAAERERHWVKLNDRPPLMRAVRAAVRRGYQPVVDARCEEA